MSDKNLLFSVVHQKVAIDVDLYHRVIYGSTELTLTVVFPSSSKDQTSNSQVPDKPFVNAPRLLQLHSRGCIIHNVVVEGYKTPFYLSDDANPVTSSPLFPPEFTTVQSELIRKKIDSQLLPYPPGELYILLPKNLLNRVITSSNRTPTPGPDGTDVLPNSFTLKIDYSLQDPVNGFNFVGGKNSRLKKQYWHAYTTNTPIALATSSWVPCFDGFWDQCSWQFNISIPRKISDIQSAAANNKNNNNNSRPETSGSSNGKTDAENEVDKDDDQSSEDEIDDTEDHDIVVVSAELSPKEMQHPTDKHKKIVSFDISNPVGAQNIGFAVGPFDSIQITDPTCDDDDDFGNEVDDENIPPVTVFSLPDKLQEAHNTCVFLYKTMEYFSRDFALFPFNSMSFCFVSDTTIPYSSSAGLCICDDKLLFPPEVIEPLFSTPEIISKALASQWSGVSLVPKTWNDIWVTNGIAGYMAQCFIRKLMGGNEYRFMLRRRTEEICARDIGMPPLGDPNFDFPLTHRDLSFISLKAPVVLFILDRRMTKTEKSLGLSRAIPKIFLQFVSGDLHNSCLSTSHFIRVCERISHSKLDSFFNQWIYGSGYPIFRVTQKFNKKRMFIEMGIRQVQSTETMPLPITDPDFVKRAKHDKPNLEKFPVQPVFTGPMTIRIHEADGSPYEHVVNLQEGFTKLDILYNTKYKRLKRSKKNKEHVDVPTIDATEDAEIDGVLLHCLGDVLQTEAEIEAWKLSDWSKEEEERMMNEAFEWIRVDTDFEWICMLYINQPDYMFASQLQQDRDVVAQYDAIKYFASLKPSKLYSSLFTKTLMDKRYFHGVRTEAAYSLARCSGEDIESIGKYHLKKAFQTLFCFENSLIPMANNFSDFSNYFLQKAIPYALSSIRNSYGRCPKDIQQFIIDLLRYNDNSSNEFSDSYYIASLISAIVHSLTVFDTTGGQEFVGTGSVDQNEFVGKAIDEIDRCLRMDSWIPSSHNLITTTIIRRKENLVHGGFLAVKFEDLIQYTKPGNYTEVRLCAFHSLLNLGGIYDKMILHYFFSTILFDEFADLRTGLIKVLTEAIGRLALRGDFKIRENKAESFMIVDDGSIMESRQHAQMRATVQGARTLVQEQLKNNISLRKGIMRLLGSKRVGLLDKRDLLDVCFVIDEPQNKYDITLSAPRPFRIVAQREKGTTIVIKRIDLNQQKAAAEASKLAAAKPKSKSKTKAVPVSKDVVATSDIIKPSAATETSNTKPAVESTPKKVNRNANPSPAQPLSSVPAAKPAPKISLVSKKKSNNASVNKTEAEESKQKVKPTAAPQSSTPSLASTLAKPSTSTTMPPPPPTAKATSGHGVTKEPAKSRRKKMVVKLKSSPALQALIAAAIQKAKNSGVPLNENGTKAKAKVNTTPSKKAGSSTSVAASPKPKAKANAPGLGNEPTSGSSSKVTSNALSNTSTPSKPSNTNKKLAKPSKHIAEKPVVPKLVLKTNNNSHNKRKSPAPGALEHDDPKSVGDKLSSTPTIKTKKHKVSDNDKHKGNSSRSDGSNGSHSASSFSVPSSKLHNTPGSSSDRHAATFAMLSSQPGSRPGSGPPSRTSSPAPFSHTQSRSNLPNHDLPISGSQSSASNKKGAGKFQGSPNGYSKDKGRKLDSSDNATFSSSSSDESPGPEEGNASSLKFGNAGEPVPKPTFKIKLKF